MAARFFSINVFSTTLCSLLLAVMATASAEENAKTYTLRYKFETGDVIRYDVDHRASVRSTMDKATQEAKTRSESVKAWKVIDVMPDGEIEFINLVEKVRMSNRVSDQAEMKYDSEKDSKPPAGFEDAAKAVGVPLSQIRMTPWGEVVDRKEKHHQPAADPNAPITVLLPEKPIAVGDAWNEPQEVTVKLADGGTKAVKTRRHFKLLSVKNDVATIEASQQVLSPVTAPIEAQLAQRMMEGKIRFDIARGRILSQQMDVDRRILGFHGPTSSMHYLMRLEERLKEKSPKVASRK